VQADPTQVHQVVMNLCTNAAQSMASDGGRLTVAVSSLHLSERDIKLHPELKPGDFVKLMIADTGGGIDPEILEKIYDPYFTTKEKGKGTGLGLSVVLGIVQSYGGAIYAYSEPGCGATFHIYIPAAENFVAEEAAPAAPPIGGNERILLVDDEPMLLDVGCQLLESLGYQVTTAHGGPAGLELFQENPLAFDLVVTDMTMPGLTGDKLAKKIWETRPDIPAILCTGYSANLSPQKAVGMGLHALVFKPFTEAEIARVVREALDG
jgi:CheY-like chemotaxis protein